MIEVTSSISTIYGPIQGSNRTILKSLASEKNKRKI